MHTRPWTYDISVADTPAEHRVGHVALSVMANTVSARYTRHIP